MAIPVRPPFTNNVLDTDELIQFDHLDKTRDYYAALWADNYTSSAFTDTSNTDHRYGWGQAAVTVGNAAVGAIVEAAHINELLSQVNAGERHQNDTLSNLTSHFTTADIIDHEDLEGILDNIDDMITNKFDLGSDNTINASEETVDSSTQTTPLASWEDGIYCQARFDFDSYQEARYFFNSGGELLVDLTTDSDSWHMLFDAMGTISIKAESTTNDPATEHDGVGTDNDGVTGIDGGGFYDMTNLYTGVAYPTNYKLLFTGQGNYSVTDGGAHTFSTGYGMYASRKVKVWGYCEDISSPARFSIHLRVELIEDVDDGEIFGTFESDFGFKQATQSPDATDLAGSNASYFTVGSTIFKFDETRYTWDENVPITVITEWTEDSSLGVTAGSASYDWVGTDAAVEGDTIQIQLQTDNVTSGTVVSFAITGVDHQVDYTLSGATSFNAAAGTGTLTVGTADVITLAILSDADTGNETMTIATTGLSTNVSHTVTISDT